MLDLFTIFSKGGIVLWCFQGTSDLFTPSVNALIKSVVLQERGGTNTFTHEALSLKFKLDNQFELVFVVAYQKMLQLSYLDKLLDDVQLEFRDRYKDQLAQGQIYGDFNFTKTFHEMLAAAENLSKQKVPRVMRTFKQSEKSTKTIASMIKSKPEEEPKKKKNGGKDKVSEKENVAPQVNGASSPKSNSVKNNIRMMKMQAKKGVTKSPARTKEKEPAPKKNTKKGTVWPLGGDQKPDSSLDFSTDKPNEDNVNVTPDEANLVGQMGGALDDYEVSESEAESSEEEVVADVPQKGGAKSSSGFGFLSGWRSLVGSKTLTEEDIRPAMDKMRDHLIGKNVASDIAVKLCDSVVNKMEGKTIGTFNTLNSTVRAALQEACVQILSPRRRIDILRDALDAKQHNRPYAITFCGVNGVGKSTNLSKVCFWLIENGLRVLIAACDTFRAGAVEQLRTHCRKLNAMHPPERHGGVQMVSLYEKGYGKDAAGVAMEALNYARDSHIDVVLIDTAGRMQDNEPLMRALAKLIKVNQPDLILFVGEALVGNDAIDQLTKFNQSLADHSQMEEPRLIDGIVLTKFDTIDDKVGAAISMTYTTGQPIVFVGTGQTYTDLKNLNAKAVVNSLLK